MGFRQGAYAKIWSVEDKGNYSICSLSISKKNKETGEYEVSFQSKFVRLVGSAHTDISKMNIPDNGLFIKINSCDVTNSYNAEKKKVYTNCVIFEFDVPENNFNNGNSSNSSNAKKTNKKTNSNVKNTSNVKNMSETGNVVSEDDDFDLPF